MKIFFAVYIVLIAGVLSLAFLVPSSKKEAIANVNRPAPAKNISAPTSSSTIKKTSITKVVTKTPAKPLPASSTSPQPTQEVGTSTTLNTEPVAPAPQASLSFSEEVEQEIHILVNAARTENGLEPLVWDSALTALARQHSDDMLSNNYFAHDNLLGCSSSCRVTASGYAWMSLGENIYTMSGFTVSSKEAAGMVVAGWLKSPGHRANILSTTYANQGVGVAVEGKTLYATEDFAKPR